LEKQDLKKKFEGFYNPSKKEFTVIDVPEFDFLMVDGRGDPNTSQDYKDAIEALFSTSYTLKFMIKKGKTAIDYGVLPLESLWWTDDPTKFSLENKSNWNWTSMIMQPKFITDPLVKEALEQVKKKKSPAALTKLRFQSFKEGLAVQVMYVGAFSAEPPTIEKMHTFIKQNGYEFNGKHHEIYLTDATRTAPEKMKTIIRQPIKKS